nr:type 1 glutamine amidotransferase domain-containing protein [uncultured Allomuricauda sp.]
MKTLKSKRFTGILFLLVTGITSAFNTAVSNDETTMTIHSKIETSKEVAAKKAVLIVLSAADTWVRADGAKYPTGYWAEEFIVIHEKFVNAGYDVHLATPRGAKPTVDPHSLDPKVAGEGVPYYKKYLSKISKDLENPKSLASINMNDYDAVIVPGGHGPVVDLYKDKDMGRVLYDAEKNGKIIGTVCHGQAALLSAVDDNGRWLFAGEKITAFSDEEEVEFGTADNAPWLLASTLRKYGADYQRGPKNWEAFIVKDENLISGQNPASSAPMADAVIEALESK